jgi:hypothetical protein
MMTLLAKTKCATAFFSTYFAGAIKHMQANFAQIRENLFAFFACFFRCNDAAMCRPF